jgi:hypothetical protein
LRAAAALGDLWLDEIWSIHLAHQAGSLAGIFTRLHHDNNHHLNTLWALCLGEDGAPIAYRLLSVVAGAVMVGVVAVSPLRADAGCAAATAAIAGLSLILVHYGSEARGYSLAMLCAVGGWIALERWLATGGRRWAAVFAVCAILGPLAHLTYVFVLGAALVRAMLAFFGARPTPRVDPIAVMLAAAPVAALALLWWVDLRHLQVGGGPSYELVTVLRDATRSLVGVSRGPLEVLALPFLALAAWEWCVLARERDGRAIFLALVIAAPPIAVWILRPEFVAPRYFVVSIPFLAILVGAGIARLAGRGRMGSAMAACVLIAFVATNGAAAARLITRGRGQYSEPLAFMLARTASGVATVGGDHDFRIWMVLQDQARRQGVLRRVAYVENAGLAKHAPEWLLFHSFEEDPAPPPRVETATGRPYALVAVYPYAGLSGWSGLLYRALPP